jgi:hypothetical protein
MNKVISYLRRSLVPVLGLMTVAVLFTACLKDKDNDNVDIPAAGLMAFNLAPDQESVVIALDGNVLTQQPLGFSNYTGTYYNIYTGNRAVKSYDYPANDPIASASHDFDTSKYYSAFVVGYGDNYRNIVAEDNFDALSATSGKAYVRYIYAVADSVNPSAVTIAKGGSNVVNDNAAFGDLSEFTAVDPGEISVAVKQGSAIDVSRNITVEEKKVYTILLIGVPGETSEAKKPQIRFVLNGALTDEDGGQ